MALPLMGIIGGAAQIAGSLIGRGARRREAKAAKAEYDAQRTAFTNFDFKNQFAGLENVAEDLTVNQQASQFQAQQTDAALGQGLDAIVASGGGGGGAQAIANAALQSKQNISANIAQQEQANQMMRVKQESMNQFREAQGADDMQLRNYDRTQQLLNMAAGRNQKAMAAKSAATSALVGGIGSAVGGIATAGVANGGFGKGIGKALTTNIGGVPDSSGGLTLEGLQNFLKGIR
tara:strand:+ start:6225 stop:6926 length:702 start_codon:yes stop_codon:yes gene_type:complete